MPLSATQFGNTPSLQLRLAMLRLPLFLLLSLTVFMLPPAGSESVGRLSPRFFLRLHRGQQRRLHETRECTRVSALWVPAFYLLCIYSASWQAAHTGVCPSHVLQLARTQNAHLKKMTSY